MGNINILLLAAGESLRMGTPKQLLAWGEDVLIQHQCKTLLQLKNPLDVVLGAHSEKIKEYIQSLPIEIIIYNEWSKGMGSSISYGVKTIFERDKACEGILICLVDQPLINESHYRKLLKAFKPGEKQIIVSCDVSGYWSPPP